MGVRPRLAIRGIVPLSNGSIHAAGEESEVIRNKNVSESLPLRFRFYEL